jgi:hypothetical protein
MVWFDVLWGEGSIGTGGIGRYTSATRRLELRRPADLKRMPIHKVIHDGDNLWAATKYVFGGDGNPPSLGLLKCEWSNKKLTQFKSVNEGPCGFVIHGIAWRNGSLWVVTDTGLSRWIKTKNQWLHYLPDKKHPSQVNTLSCPEIYTYLFREFANMKASCDFDCDIQLWENLQRFRPGYYQRIKGVAELSIPGSMSQPRRLYGFKADDGCRMSDIRRKAILCLSVILPP